jgi:D-glycero-D-manno-heptose 1,7-bisphosphate phosphatase
MSRKAIFLDRDGVLIAARILDGKPYPPDRLDDVCVLDGVPEALQALKQSGFLLIVVTNQPDVARGTQTVKQVEIINQHLLDKLPLDSILTCFHDESDACECRKPRPGLLLQAKERYDIELQSSYLVGDRWKDIAAGQAAGCLAIFIDYRYAEMRPKPPFFMSNSLLDSLRYILPEKSHEKVI